MLAKLISNVFVKVINDVTISVPDTASCTRDAINYIIDKAVDLKAGETIFFYSCYECFFGKAFELLGTSSGTIQERGCSRCTLKVTDIKDHEKYPEAVHINEIICTEKRGYARYRRNYDRKISHNEEALLKEGLIHG